MQVLVKFYWDCGRNGDLSGVFIAEKDKVESIIGKDVYFGEVLGKHSDICGTIEEKDIKTLSEDQDFIKKCLEIFGTKNISGYNPLDYMEE
jgi:methyl coenzyme M reductase gamma subunit